MSGSGSLRAALAAALLAWAPATAQDLSGFGELRASAEIGADGTWWQVVERFRPTFTGELSERMALEATIELAASQGRHLQTEFARTIDESDFGPLLAAAGCTWPEPGVPVLNVDGIDDILTVERFFADVYLSWGDLRVGRQALTWGSALMINPTDPFPELLVAEPWRPRRGQNAARAIIALPGYNDLTAVVGTNDALDAARAAGRLRLDAWGTDVALVGAYRSDGDGSGIVGLDVKGTLELGYWLEGAVHLGDDDPFVEVAVGLDYSFPVLDMLVVSAQYVHNGSGRGDAGGGLSGGLDSAISPPDCGCLEPAAGDPATALFGDAAAERDPFAPLLSGRHYALLAANLAFDEDISASLFVLSNLGDGSALLVPTVTVITSDWLQLAVSARVGLDLDGEGGEFDPDPDDLRIEVPGVGAADFSGLVPAASVTAWARASF